MLSRIRNGVRRLSPLTSRVLILAATLLLALSLTAAIAAWKLWHDAEIAGEQQANSLGVVLAEQTQRSLQAIDVVLREFIADGRAAGVTTPEKFQQFYDSYDFFQVMRDRLKTLPQTAAFAAVTTDGKLVNLSRQWPVPAVDLSDREYISGCQQSPPDGIFITGLVFSRVGHVPAFYLARCMLAPDGALIGVVMSVPTIPYYLDFYRSIGLPKGISVAIRRAAGDALLVYPEMGPHAPALMLDTPEGHFVSRHQIAFKKLLVDVGVSRDMVFALWRKQLSWIVAGTLCAIACLLTLLQRLVMAIRGLEASEQSLLERSSQLQERTQSLLSTALALRVSEAKLTRQTHLLEVTLDHMDQGLVMVNADLAIAVCNRRCAEMLDLPPELLKSKPQLAEVVAYQRQHGEFAADSTPPVEIMSVAPMDAGPHIYERTRPNGVILEVRSVPLQGGGMVRTYTDITSRKRAEAELEYVAYHDQLTGLANRHRLYNALSERLEPAPASGPGLAVLLLDLDRFKLVNDTLGHAAGDELLAQVAQRMQTHIRAGDLLARLGGDEFAAVLMSADAPDTAISLAERLKSAVSAPFLLEGEAVRVGVSIGIALSPRDGIDVESIMRSADAALYRAKASGRDAIRCYEIDAEKQDRIRLLLEHDLRIALQQEQFEIVYQPIFNALTNAAYSYEALLRWRHPTRGLLTPEHFISIAEETGIINDLGRWVLNTACREAATWSLPVRLAVNLSTVQFSQPDLELQVMEALEASGLPGHRLDLEVTESVLITDSELTRDTMHALQRRGVRFVMDDFGTGHSSLKSLQGFPFQMIKIDGSFIRNIEQEAGAGAIVRAILTIAAAMGLEVVAEGIETEDHVTQMRELGCALLQGYLLQRPQSPEQVRDYLWRCNVARQDGGHEALVLVKAV